MRRFVLAVFPGALVALPIASCSIDPALTSGGDGQVPADSGFDATGGNDGPADVVAEALPTIDAPSCGTGAVCVDPVPSGWTGPLAVFDQAGGPPAPQAPACPSAYPSDVFDGNATPSAPAAVCDCTCGSVSGSTCGASTLDVYSGSSCNNTNCFTGQVSSCSSLACNTGNSARATPPTPSGGTCAGQPSKSVPAWGWTHTGRACRSTSTGAGCSGNSLCVPVPAAPFASTVCILQTGDVACPPGMYTQKALYYGGATDTRDCSTCTCNGATGGSCTGGVMTIWDASNCSGSSTTLAIDGQCHGASGITTITAKQTTAPTPSGGSCNASSGSGKATGSVTPTGPTTVCCAP